MHIARTDTLGLRELLICTAILSVLPLAGGERAPGNVPPTMEIEVLDPNADPLGRPAIELRSANGITQVDIPPTILVHRFYYTGDRSFQAQLLPGGPCIVVVHHPKTGERCYIEMQMLPGAPRVTYTGHSIHYDYNRQGITLQFGLFGNPTIKYRNGPTWQSRVGDLVHAEEVASGMHVVGSGVKRGVDAGARSLHEAAIDTHAMVKSATLPVVNLLRYVPLGAAVLDPERARVREEKLANQEREQALDRARDEQRMLEPSLRTIR